jgi:hypothetical protein
LVDISSGTGGQIPPCPSILSPTLPARHFSSSLSTLKEREMRIQDAGQFNDQPHIVIIQLSDGSYVDWWYREE